MYSKESFKEDFNHKLSQVCRTPARKITFVWSHLSPMRFNIKQLTLSCLQIMLPLKKRGHELRIHLISQSHHFKGLLQLKTDTLKYFMEQHIILFYIRLKTF